MKIGKRILIWLMVLIISMLLTIRENNQNKPKQDVKLYVSSEFSGANEKVEEVINDFNSSYSAKVFNKKNKEISATVTTEFSEISSNNYEVLGKTPLVVIMKPKEKLINAYKENGLLKSSKKIKMNDDDEIEINFKKLMDAVIKNESWSKFGGKDKEIRIFYPELTTTEGKLFKHFLLITANKGFYPTEKEQMEASQEYVEKFLAQPNVHPVNVINRLTGVNDIGTDIYITFENNALQLDSDKYGDEIYVTYPTETVVKQVFFESNSKIGEDIQKELKTNTGIMGGRGSLEDAICGGFAYRYENRKDIQTYRNARLQICYNVNFKDAYNYVEIPEQFLKEKAVR